MQKNFDAPELRLIGQAGEVVMGAGTFGDDNPLQLPRISNSSRTACNGKEKG